jgi:hypothetical protein
LVQTTGHCKGRVNGMSRCKGCGHTEYCALVTGTSWGRSERPYQPLSTGPSAGELNGGH